MVMELWELGEWGGHEVGQNMIQKCTMFSKTKLKKKLTAGVTRCHLQQLQKAVLGRKSQTDKGDAIHLIL